MFGLMPHQLVDNRLYVSQNTSPYRFNQWNILIGFGILFVGFLMTTRWRDLAPTCGGSYTAVIIPNVEKPRITLRSTCDGRCTPKKVAPTAPRIPRERQSWMPRF
jgi:hypothetical protein